MNTIPVNNPIRQYRELREEIDLVIREVMSSGYWLNGPWTRRFAEEFARWCGVAHCIPVANGTDALELALRSLGIAPGDEVITVANAGGYATTACRLVGATPVWADVTTSSLGLDIERVGDALDERTKVIVVTHLYGIMVDVPALRAELDRCGGAHIRIVEDCAQAHGAVMYNRKAGAFGDVAAFSFYPTKNLGALGDAGALVTNDPEIADRVSRLSQYGWGERYHSTVPMGRNSRMDELQAAILCVKLPHLERWNEARRKVIARYVCNLHAPMRMVGTCASWNVGHLAVLRTPQRDQMRTLLAAEGIATDIHYPVLDCDQVSQRTLPGRRLPLPESVRAIQEIVTLPCFAELTTAELDKTILTVNRIAVEH
jgi:dTDP-4-amino-4,6-dideoxygalactose transaminase